MFFGSPIVLLTFFLSLTAFMLAIFSFNADTHIAHLSGSNPSGGATVLYYSHGAATNTRMEADASDTSGAVLGTLSGTGPFEAIVHFSQPFSVSPKAVILQAATPITGVPDPNYRLTLESVNTVGFDVVGFTSTTMQDGVLFYYVVI